MRVNIFFKEQQIQWNEDEIPLKTIGAVHDRKMCSMLYSMYTDSLLFQEVEETLEQMLDCNYSNLWTSMPQ